LLHLPSAQTHEQTQREEVQHLDTTNKTAAQKQAEDASKRRCEHTAADVIIFDTYERESLKFEVLTAVEMLMLVFWVLTTYGLVDKYQRFGGTYCLRHQG
jgi:hypothetical protein